MEDKGRGIFYGVIGVATLIITIIGATFAYFSAEAESEEDAITATGAQLSLELTPVEDGIKANLIPVDETMAGFAAGGYVGSKAASLGAGPKGNCLDDYGNVMCSVFEFTITNPSVSAQRIYGTLNVQTNTFPNNAADAVAKGTLDETLYQGKSNLAFAVFKGSAKENKISNWDVDGNAVTTVSDTLNNIIGAEGDMVMGRTPIPSTAGLSEGETVSFELTPLTQTLAANGGSATYTIVVWLHETEYNQNADKEKSFAAGLNFTTEYGGKGVTAVLSTTGPTG